MYWLQPGAKVTACFDIEYKQGSFAHKCFGLKAFMRARAVKSLVLKSINFKLYLCYAKMGPKFNADGDILKTASSLKLSQLGLLLKRFVLSQPLAVVNSRGSYPNSF